MDVRVLVSYFTGDITEQSLRSSLKLTLFFSKFISET